MSQSITGEHSFGSVEGTDWPLTLETPAEGIGTHFSRVYCPLRGRESEEKSMSRQQYKIIQCLIPKGTKSIAQIYEHVGQEEFQHDNF